jgi:two-component system response regulator HydG
MQSIRNRILYVDDDKDTCTMMKVLLGMWNYEVAMATTAADGLHLAESEYFDMCLLDIHLLEESGIELCKRICEVPGHAPVVFISASSEETDKQRGRQAGALAYLTKPLDFDVLEVTLTRLITKALGSSLENSWECATGRNYFAALSVFV